MSDPVQLALIAAVPATIAAFAGWRIHGAVCEVSNTLVEVKVSLNGRLEQLLAATKAQGRLDEQRDVDRDAAQKAKGRLEGGE